MFHLIEGILRGPELDALREAADALDFEDGARTAGGLAKAVKANAQAAETPARGAVLAKAEAALLAHPLFASAARPREIVRLIVSRYGPQQTYGLHVDDALMQGARTDLSFTLALSDPESYEGGALVVADRVEERAFRPAAGDAILYPSDTLHRVEPVRSGTRLCIVGWVTSWVRHTAQREILVDLDAAVAAEQAGPDRSDQMLRLSLLRSNLLRMWAG